jgi:hypothetical protein
MSDVIYSPLDVPELVSWCDFDFAKFEAWRADAVEHIQAMQRRTYAVQESNAPDLAKQHYYRALRPHGQEYPWDRVQAKMSENFQWVADFDRRFPEVCEYLLTFFPFTEITTITFLDQRKQSRVMLHRDLEGHSSILYGYRSYLINEEDEPALFFCRPQGPLLPAPPVRTLAFYEERDVLVPTAWKDCFPSLTKEYAKFASPTQSWMLNHGRVPHGVDAVAGRRLVLLPTGKVDIARQHALVRRSVEKFKDYAIV